MALWRIPRAIWMDEERAARAAAPQVGVALLRLVVCGACDEAEMVFAALDIVHRSRGISEVITGGEQGAGRDASDWANARGVMCTVLEPDWARHRRLAEMVRDDEMIKLRPHGIIAFPDGRAGVVALAREVGIPVWTPPWQRHAPCARKVSTS